MKKNIFRVYAILAIIFIAFSVIAFAVPFVKNSSFVLAYIGGMLAIGYQIYIFHISFSEGNNVKSKLYGFPIAQIGVVYLISQIILSLVEMAMSALIFPWLVVVINIVIFATVLVGTISVDAMRDEIIRQDNKIVKDVERMRNLQSLTSSLLSLCQEYEMKHLVENMVDEFKYSDPVSSEQTIPLENELKELIEDLQNSIITNDKDIASELCSKILIKLRERNRICAISK